MLVSPFTGLHEESDLRSIGPGTNGIDLGVLWTAQPSIVPISAHLPNFSDPLGTISLL